MCAQPQNTDTLSKCLETSPTRFRAFLGGCLLVVVVVVVPIIFDNELFDSVCPLARALIARGNVQYVIYYSVCTTSALFVFIFLPSKWK